MFRENRDSAEVGDRIGMCLSKFDKKLMERGVVCTPNYAVRSHAIIIPVKKITHFKLPVITGTKYHISIGHETCMGTVSLFSISKELIMNKSEFSYDLEYNYCNELIEEEESKNEVYYALIEFGKPVFTMPKCLVIGSKLEMDVHTNSCRLAFSGSMLVSLNTPSYRHDFLPKIKVFKTRRKEGVVDRMVNDSQVIVKNMFHKEANIEVFTGLQVSLSTGETGIIEGHFGQTGKIKISIEDSLKKETIENLANKKNKNYEGENYEPIKVFLEFKSYIYDKNCKLKQ